MYASVVELKISSIVLQTTYCSLSEAYSEFHYSTIYFAGKVAGQACSLGLVLKPPVCLRVTGNFDVEVFAVGTSAVGYFANIFFGGHIWHWEYSP